uniref:Uncharacterized protein n=1 Tax=Eutreptiella gymnastica TaxID=73025 RepID=A0A7S1IA32_9EUGL|mmetsp:Transcript_141998/g.247521  ORF Transcript_141998/g.247521 Transcript_141998/m.247521 type:complete len:391 (+) Transcript_141998:44-1216(+)
MMDPAEDTVAQPAEDPAVYGASITLIGGPFHGEDLWLGGELGADGNIYGVPGTGKTVLKIDPRTDMVTEFGNLRGLKYMSSIARGKFKWLRGARAPNGDFFGIPSNANVVLRLNRVGEISTIGDPEILKGHWKWHGAVLAGNGNLYGCPCNAERILKIVPGTGEVSLICGPFPGQQKWYGAVVGHDGCVYCIPNNAPHVLKFDPVTETAELLGDLPQGGWKWHGAATGGDGAIYGVPAQATSVLKIVPGTGEVRTIGGPLPQGKYKWGGATRAANGDVFCFPSDAAQVLRIAMGVPDDRQVGLVGPVFPTTPNNKWQNGFLGRDNAIYGLPCNAEAVLRISEAGEVTTVGGPWPGKEKWEGGVMAESGVIYAMPQQARAVLRIDPGPVPG